MGVDGVTASLPAATLFAPLPVTTLALEDVTVRFRDGVCEEAAGRVRATVVGEAGGLPLPPTMMGTARCEAGALLLPMAGQGGTSAYLYLMTGNAIVQGAVFDANTEFQFTITYAT